MCRKGRETLDPPSTILGGWTIRDTMLLVCPFSKCALWDRYAVVASVGRAFWELCSVMKIYRYKCRSPAVIPRTLLRADNRDRFLRLI